MLKHNVVAEIDALITKRILEFRDSLIAKKQIESILDAAILTKQDFAFNGSSTLMRSVGG